MLQGKPQKKSKTEASRFPSAALLSAPAFGAQVRVPDLVQVLLGAEDFALEASATIGVRKLS